MASTRTPGITTSIDGRRFIDKRYRGVRIGMRVGAITQERAELRLGAQMQRIDLDFARRANPRPVLRRKVVRRSSEPPRTRSALELGHVSDHPSHDRAVRSGDAAIGHQLDAVAI